MSDALKEANEGRERLQQALVDTAAVLQTLAEALTISVATLVDAASREAQSTSTYIASLERELSQHRGEASQ